MKRRVRALAAVAVLTLLSLTGLTGVRGLTGLAGAAVSTPSASAQAATPLRITGITATAGDAGGLYLPWGWEATRVSFAAPALTYTSGYEPSGYSYRVRVAGVSLGKVTSTALIGGDSGMAHRGFVEVAQHSAKEPASWTLLKAGRRYTFRVQELHGKKVVATSAPYIWKPVATTAPKRLDVDTLTAADGVQALVAGQTYRLAFSSGRWEKDARVRVQALAMDEDGRLEHSLTGTAPATATRWYDTLGYSAASAEAGAITIKPAAKDAGTWLHLVVYGQATGRLPWGWEPTATYNLPIVATTTSAAQWGIGSRQTGAVTVDGPATSTVGATYTAHLDVSAANQQRYDFAETYQWVRIGADGTETPIAGATSSSYVTTSDDTGASLEVEVTFSPGDPDYGPAIASAYAQWGE